MIIKACPICGNEVLYNCWHPETEEIDSIDMPIAQAIKLASKQLKQSQLTVVIRRDVLLDLRLKEKEAE